MIDRKAANVARDGINRARRHPAHEEERLIVLERTAGRAIIIAKGESPATLRGVSLWLPDIAELNAKPPVH
jgi:hypothetical protein